MPAARRSEDQLPTVKVPCATFGDRSDTFAVVKLGGRSAVARLRADARIAPAAVTELAFNMGKAVFFDPDSEVRIR